MTNETEWADTHKAAMKRCEERAAARSVAESPRVFLPTCFVMDDVVRYEVLESIDGGCLRRREVVEAHRYGEQFERPFSPGDAKQSVGVAREPGTPCGVSTTSAGFPEVEAHEAELLRRYRGHSKAPAERIKAVTSLVAALGRAEGGAHITIRCHSNSEMLRWRGDLEDAGIQFDAVDVAEKWVTSHGYTPVTSLLPVPGELRVPMPFGSLLEIKRGS